MFIRKYQNRCNTYDNSEEISDKDTIPISKIITVLNAPKIQCGCHIFADAYDVCEKLL